mmetsp:Transcript_12699/g.21386  ORF Transcript_12699/g.21386 Transcript_12699/m.21386 type:complete len:146 (+) Transcript_12699:1510-1947(+)
MVKNSEILSNVDDPQVRFSSHKVVQDQPSGAAYKNMNNLYYFVSTLSLFVVEAILSVIVDDVTTVFDFVAAISVTCIGFAFPAVFYLTAEKRYMKEEEKGKSNTRMLAYLHAGLAVIAFVACMLSNVITIVQESRAEDKESESVQ